MASESILVGVRVRKLLDREFKKGSQLQWEWDGGRSLIWAKTSGQQQVQKSYNYDRVFTPSDGNDCVYEQLAAPVIASVIQGFNATIFAYGQTASGKTHTMMSEDDPGVIRRAVSQIFEELSNSPQNIEYLIRVSYMEIYNEELTDLLTKPEKRKPLKLMDDGGQTKVDNLLEVPVSSEGEVYDLMQYGERYRHFGETNMNERSSRSHTIFRICIEWSEVEEDSSVVEGEGRTIVVSTLNLVDLAGSERAAQTGAEGARFREGVNINSSLLVLGQVIAKLAEQAEAGPGRKEQVHIPFRDSKLTRILKNSLGGNARTIIICTISPAEKEQSRSTLEFASRAKTIKTHATKNEIVDDRAQMIRDKKEIKQLQELLMQKDAQLNAIIDQDQKKEDERTNLLDKLDKLQNFILHSRPNLNEEPVPKAKELPKRRMSWHPNLLQKRRSSLGFALKPIVLDDDLFRRKLEEMEARQPQPVVEPESKSPLSKSAEDIQRALQEEFQSSVIASPTLRAMNLETLPQRITERRKGRSNDRKVRFTAFPSPLPMIGEDDGQAAASATAPEPIHATETPRTVLRERLRRKEEHIERLSQEYKELQEFTRLESQLVQDSSTAVSGLSSEIQLEVDDALKHVHLVKQDCEILRSALAREQSLRIREREELMVLRDAIAVLEKEKKEAELAKVPPEDHVTNPHSDGGKLLELEQRIVSLAAEHDHEKAELKSILESAQADLSDLKKKLDDSQAQVAKLSATDELLAAKEAALSELTARNSNLEAKWTAVSSTTDQESVRLTAEFEAATKAKEAALAEVEQLRLQLGSDRVERDALADQLAKAQSETDRLMQEMAAHRAAATQLEDELVTEQKRATLEASRERELSDEVEKMRSDLANVRKEQAAEREIASALCSELREEAVALQERLAEAQSATTQSETGKKSLAARCEDLQVQVASLEKEKKEAELAIEVLKAEFESKYRDGETLGEAHQQKEIDGKNQEEMKALRDAVAALEEEKKKAELAKDALVAQLERARSDEERHLEMQLQTEQEMKILEEEKGHLKAALEKEKKEADSAKEALKAELASAHSRGEKLREMQLRQQELEIQEAEMTNLRDTVAALEKEQNEAKLAREALESQLTSALSGRENLLDALSTLQKEKSEAESKNELLEAQLATERSELENVKLHLEKEQALRIQDEEEIMLLRDTLTVLGKEKTEAESAKEALEAQLASAHSGNEELLEVQQLLGQERNLRIQEEDEMALLRNTVEAMEKERKVAEVAVETLREQLSSAHSAREALLESQLEKERELRDAVAALERERIEAKSSKESLEAQLSSAQSGEEKLLEIQLQMKEALVTQGEELKSLRATVTALEEERKESESVVEALKEQVASARVQPDEEALAETRLQMDQNLRAAMVALEEERNGANLAKVSLKAQLSSMHSELDKLKLQLEKEGALRSRNEEEIRALRDAVEALEKEKNEVDASKEALEVQLASVHSGREKLLEMQLQKEREALSELKKSQIADQREIFELKARVEKASRNLDFEKQFNRELKEKLRRQEQDRLDSTVVSLRGGGACGRVDRKVETRSVAVGTSAEPVDDGAQDKLKKQLAEAYSSGCSGGAMKDLVAETYKECIQRQEAKLSSYREELRKYHKENSRLRKEVAALGGGAPAEEELHRLGGQRQALEALPDANQGHAVSNAAGPSKENCDPEASKARLSKAGHVRAVDEDSFKDFKLEFPMQAYRNLYRVNK